MLVKKSGGKVYGAVFTAAERKAMNMEIHRQFAEISRSHSIEIDSIILWLLHEEFGFGEKRLRRFYDLFRPSVEDLADRYELCANDLKDDMAWICTHKLKDIGIDLEQWEKENAERKNVSAAEREVEASPEEVVQVAEK